MEFGTVNFQDHFICCFKVNYVGKAGNLYQSGYQLNGSAYVISKHISNTWLWDRVRVSGGAYGGFCDFDTHSGTSILFLDLLLTCFNFSQITAKTVEKCMPHCPFLFIVFIKHHTLSRVNYSRNANTVYCCRSVLLFVISGSKLAENTRCL